MPITDCQKYFQREGRPREFFSTTLRQSSTQPMTPKPTRVSSATQTYSFDRSPHSSVVTVTDTRISAPPMVGVPALIRWVCGPSSRTDWPIFSAVSLRITAGPTMKEMVRAVSVASTARRVR